MKNNSLLKLCALAAAMFATVNYSKAAISLTYEIAEITSGGILVGSGTVLFVSHGTDNSLNSNAWSSGNSFVLGDDSFFAAVAISNGVAAGFLSNLDLPARSNANSTHFSAIFIAGLTSSDVDYSTGSLLGGKTFGVTGTTYNFGTYRNTSPEAYGASATGKIGYVFPSDGTYDLFTSSNTGDYTGASFTANLATSSSFNVVPEPSTASLMLLGSAGLVALRRLRKV